MTIEHRNIGIFKSHAAKILKCDRDDLYLISSFIEIVSQTCFLKVKFMHKQTGEQVVIVRSFPAN